MVDYAAYVKQSCYVDGRWVDASDGEKIAVTDPATGEHVADVPGLSRADAAQAVAAARRAFTDWSRRPAAERADYLMKLHDVLMRDKAQLGALLTREMGKPLKEAEGEIAYSASFFKWFAEEARRMYGDVIPSPFRDKRIITVREPVGVAAAITPWNFPSAMIARKAAAALAAGCTFVSKPAEATPLSALAYGVIADEIGLPAGVLNIVTGKAAPIGEEFCENPDVAKITFTGSTSVGKLLAKQAGAHMKRVSMELGGNAPFIVFADADLDRAVEGAMASKYRNSGQTCVCANRILVEDAVYDAFAEKFAARIAGLKVGNGFEDGVAQGPLINEDAVKKVEEHIADALEKGARTITGGRRHQLGGTYFEPTALYGVTTEMQVAHEETFGPVAPLFRFHSEEEAFALANDTEFGLASYVYTNDLGRAWRALERLEYGMVGINEWILSTEVAPFGGVKDSGMGREGSKYGLDDYTHVKYALMGGLGM